MSIRKAAVLHGIAVAGTVLTSVGAVVAAPTITDGIVAGGSLATVLSGILLAYKFTKAAQVASEVASVAPAVAALAPVVVPLLGTAFRPVPAAAAKVTGLAPVALSAPKAP